MERFRFSPRPNRAGEIEWREWGGQAFAEAAAEGKPVLLSISAVWCHWCHVMDETSLSDGANIAAINERFVPIRVDADRRPDIQERYLMGGWPTVAALTAAGGILAGGTYMPPPALGRWLEDVAEHYAERPDELEEATAKAIAAAAAERPPPRTLDPHFVRAQLDVLADVFDPSFGGFGRAPKFPDHPAMELLLAWDAAAPEPRFGHMIATTLDAMMSGGLMDREWGGFFRYSTTQDWRVPHYEKMLADQAGHTRVYAAARAQGGPEAYLETARRTASYVLDHLAVAGGAMFLGSQDADEEFYRLDAAARRGREEPFVDPVGYTASSADMVSALLSLARVDADPRWRDAALAALDRLVARVWDPDRGVAHVDEGDGTQPEVYGLLDDAAYLAGACLDAADAIGASGDGATPAGGGGAAYLDTASAIVGWAHDALADEGGGFADRAAGAGGDEGALAIRHRPPGGNAVMARVLCRLGAVTGDGSHRTRALDAVAASAPSEPTPLPDSALVALAMHECLTGGDVSESS